ncbi:hypothetical protein FNV43_RR09780 [Rhamnella rubrinervis]|uniref:Uncharacterized protein n=1 Tax=Rhamnella rubrinervis TaxID=2594499 RepID=A0A8K0HAK5_9ROSA|nr:hypothetical protein FNV43_RR09780 [Rhamnella rubrinervis]
MGYVVVAILEPTIPVESLCCKESMLITDDDELYDDEGHAGDAQERDDGDGIQPPKKKARTDENQHLNVHDHYSPPQFSVGNSNHIERSTSSRVYRLRAFRLMLTVTNAYMKAYTAVCDSDECIYVGLRQ